jgi:hypothetical protein
MAIYSIDHCVGVARDLSDRLTLRLENQTGSTALNTVRQTQDSLGYPILVVSHNGVESESNPVIWIRIKNLFEPIAGVSPAGAPVDVFGNATMPFTPSVSEMAVELNGAGAPIPSTQDYSTCLFEIARTGTVVSEFSIANGTAVSQTSVEAQITAGTGPVQTLKDIDWGFKGNT